MLRADSVFFSPASVYIWFMMIDLAIFLWIVEMQPNRADYTFTAMPWPLFDSVVLQTVLLQGTLLCAGFLSSVNMRGLHKKIYTIPDVQVAIPKSIRGNLLFITEIFLIATVLLEIYHLWDVDVSILWSNTDYLTINNPDTAGIDTLLGRIIHFLLRPLGLILVGVGAFWATRRRWGFAVLFLFVSVYPFLVAFAQNSRWAPLYLGVALIIVAYFDGIKKNWLFLFSGGVVTFLLFLKVLIGRGTTYQGLGGTDKIFSLIFSDFQILKWIVSFFLNTFLGVQGIANAFLRNPHYPEVYKFLSFAPTISALDGFDRIREVYQIKLAPVVPMSSYAEAYFFGPAYFIFLLLILTYWLRYMTKLARRGDMFGTAFTAFSYFAIFYLSQYAVRNSMRLIYISLVIGWVIEYWRRVKFARERAKARVLAERADVS